MTPHRQPARIPAPMLPQRPMDPRDRLRLCGPIRPMPRTINLIERLIERLLFG